MKKALSIIMILIMLLSVLSSCGQSYVHTHEWGEWITINEATCTEKGKLSSICACGEEQIKYLSATGHSFGDWMTTKEPTCTENGEQVRCCDCGETKTRDIYATGHSFGDWITVNDATCVEKGLQKRTCECGETDTKDIYATGHIFGDWKTVKEANCTNDGMLKRTCDCGEEETKAIEALGHDWEDATCTTPKTCQNCYKTEGEALGHIDDGGYCSVCGEKVSVDMATVVGDPNECDSISYFGFCFYKNTADGIKVCWGGENLSGKTINYYTITFYFYNAVDDPAYSEITGKSTKTLKYVGPVAPGEDLLVFSIVDYVPTCSKVMIGEITLEYSDGTSDTGWYGWYTTYKNSSIK